MQIGRKLSGFAVTVAAVGVIAVAVVAPSGIIQDSTPRAGTDGVTITALDATTQGVYQDM